MQNLGFEPYYSHPFVQKLSTMTKQPPFLIVAVCMLLFLILLFTPIGFMLTTSLTFLIPAYQTFKVLETKDEKDYERMLTFWVSFGFVYLFNNLFESLLSFLYFFHIIRAALIVFLYVPRFDGAKKIYTHLIHPFFTKYSPHINKVIAPMEERTRKVSQNFKKTE